jgi:hypothetical protein
MNNIFLAAAIPPKDIYKVPTNRIAARDSVLALVSQMKPGDELCFGGHPAITPFVITAAESLGALKQISIYQANWFREEVPAIHYKIARFVWDDGREWGRGTRPPVETDEGASARNLSLAAMRAKMLSTDRRYTAGFFIGGKDGVVAEFELFRRNHPQALLFPMGSTGGAAQHLWYERRDQIYESWENYFPAANRWRENLNRLYKELGDNYLYRSLIKELFALSSDPDQRPDYR